MELFRIKKDIAFMRHAKVFNAISFATFLIAVAILFSKGLHLSVEFTGGTLMELQYTQAPSSLEPIRDTLTSQGLADSQVQTFGSTRDILIRVPNRTNQSSAAVSTTVFGAICESSRGAVRSVSYQGPQGEQLSHEACFDAGDKEIVNVKRVEFVGPQVGEELATDGAMALLVVILGIVAYLAVRFEWRFAVSTIVANLHDVVIILGFFSLFQWEFSLPVLAAVLAVLGYSVNESVVVFDRVRETLRNSRLRGMTIPQVLDHAITRTISRTIITHGSTQAMVLCMLFFGGPSLHYFAIALTIGICFGIYSSVLVAGPMAMWLGISREHFIKAAVKKDEAVV
ncbi:MAG: protein translocase subunit SecF [Candidatus Dactylopiibacterium carminicum]|uniref:Protein-export membrane protein SecF n=1 Tax=Candidatus Dactylopiibacterium carminicum TaxID=857335 RepID=A0A272EQA4_9RHOO|nr:protein translocase subunit SecF [Candidatus Dactylopiibacterium carminicum]KAF7598577.1 protein translocase subunit SecF [Candidatus Dactylopiibacterium carminicum]PAS92289.1 MAG: protein translocase subunit SecF [Candidatus Dactylopiibacterium carminicum]PAS93987.1 MAG: protein translocase subunit SecF [Candidatus Dactylopiibacterium carminicum]PAS98238.1 MAG: protein-export membrane protein SecF [Candidatus Dactylopiibacterium carminicum]